MLTDFISWISIQAGHHGLPLAAGCAGCLLVALLFLDSCRNHSHRELVVLARIVSAWGIAYAALSLFGDESAARNIPHLGVTISVSLMALSLILLKQRTSPSSGRTKKGVIAKNTAS